MSYRIIDGNSILILNQKTNEIEDFILSKGVDLNKAELATKAYSKGKLPLEDYLNIINPEVGKKLENEKYEQQIKYFTSLIVKRKAKRLHDELDIIEKDDDGNCYLKNHNWIIPQSIVDRLLDAKFNPHSNYKIDSLLMFLKQLMLCPNKNVRDNAINYIERNGMFITANGMLLTFRRANKGNTTFNGQIESIYNKIKSWKKAPKNYTLFENEESEIIYRTNAFDELFIDTPEGIYNNIGNLEVLYNEMQNNSMESNKYFPNHKDNTQFFINGVEHNGNPYYEIGKETRLPREYCDESDNTCSRGLHSWSKLDHNSYRGFGNKILAVLISPIDFVSCPYGDNSKMRSAALFPVFELEENDLNEFDESCIGDIELDYFNYSMDVINDEFNKSKEERIIKFNNEITEQDIKTTFEEINDIVESRNINLYE